MEIFGLTIVDILLIILCLGAIWFYCFAIYAAIAFGTAQRAIAVFNHPHPIDSDFHPPITILKPICGLDREAYENLASFCRQDYSSYQIIFSVRDPHDPGITVVKQIIQDFPHLDMQLVVCDRIIGTNLKVSNLANAVTKAKYDILLIADSDIRVGTDYLQRVIQPLSNSNVGVVTCPYRSLAQGWVGILDALGTATDFQAGVLVATKLEGIKFALGSTIVIRKAVLEKIGGFEAIADYLADDFQLGNLPTQAGYQVALSDYVVEHVLSESSLADSLQRQIRWARCIRVSRLWGYLGLIFTHGTAISLLFLLTTGGSILSWIVLSTTWITRIAMAWVVGVWYLNDSVAKNFLWFIPLRDLISFTLWCYSLVGNTVKWRGQQLKLIKGGKLVPVQ